MRSRVRRAAGIAAFVSLAVSSAPEARNLYAISDLHFGIGHAADGSWENYEDFRWNDEWVAFLKALGARSPGGADLVLNGDTFELWQSTARDCEHDESNRDWGCSEGEARERLVRVLAAHKEAIAALRTFSEEPGNRVILVPGNHDAALLFGSVRAALVKVAGPKVEVAVDGYWLTPDRTVLFEHGHQWDDLNEMKPWPKPFRQEAGVTYLVRPWGESFVQQVFDAQERQYPIIDNINDNQVGIEYYIEAEARESGQDPTIFWARLGIKADRFGQFLRFAMLRTSWRQFVTGLGGNRPPEWDVAGIQQANDVQLLLALIPDDAIYGDAMRLAAKSPEGIGLAWSDFSPGEIYDLCTGQAVRALASNRSDLRMCSVKSGTALGGGDARSLGAATTMLFSTPKLVLRQYLKTRQAQLAANTPGWDGKFKAYVFSHTHKVQNLFKVIDHGSWQPIGVNTGAWQRIASPAYIEARRSGDDPAYEVLKLQPEVLAPCYSLVEILPGGEDKPTVLFWRLGGGSWEFESSCPDDPGLLNP